jgi:cellulose synthase/poly-beta-1,6-N-acetylglucosamine synthase-like glycosyltransferase
VCAVPALSVIVATRGRTRQLERCLTALTRQTIAEHVEIIVVDNAPQPSLAGDLLRRFPDVRVINESRIGLSCARNAGLAAAHGEIFVFTDDDTEAGPDWLSRLVQPFVRPEITGVTGNVRPMKMETEAERLFEAYGGLGRGESYREYGREWLRSQKLCLPLWRIGATANAAFRAVVFKDPNVGALDEHLGAGSPTGAWEDLYLFYRMLGQSYVIAYEPRAVILHAHRERLEDLKRQLQAYRRGEVAFCLLVLWRHHEWRAIPHLLLWIPYWRLTQFAGELCRRLCGRRRFNLRIAMHEWWAYLQGPVALWISHRHVQRRQIERPSPGELERRNLSMKD